MFQLLLGAGALYVVLGNIEEALALLFAAVASISIGVVQEIRTERTLEALRDLTSPRALVIRDGRRMRIAGRDLVRGDLVILSEGDRVPGDAVLLQADDLELDESLLTGEALPVGKIAWNGIDTFELRPSGDNALVVFSGTLVVRGQGTGEVQAIGGETAIGKIGKSLSGIGEERTPLHLQTRRVVRLFALLGVSFSLVLILALGLIHHDWIEAALSGITLAMATLPEEFPLVLSVFLALGAWRISRRHVLTRRAAAIEALGAATVLCSDKTGTLTQNRMAVAVLAGSKLEWWAGSARGSLPEGLRLLAETAYLASRPEPTDPMEVALRDLAVAQLGSGPTEPNRRILHEYPLRPGLLAFSNLWEERGQSSLIAAAKGAPEAIADICHLSNAETDAIRQKLATLAASGLRVLGVARATVPTSLKDASSQHDFAFTFLGLVGFADPLRAGIVEAIAACKTAGIRVAMITGDHPETARAIATQAGLGAEAIMVTGPQMETLDVGAATDTITKATIFARTMPDQKLSIVNALKAAGEVVAMTGDGVNDAPALKAAHIGIAMGQRGTDVAREAAGLVLLNDDFGSIVEAIRLGRQIHDNLMKAMRFIISVHLPVVGLSLIPVLLGWPALLMPIHVVFLELLIDPVCSIVFECEEAERDVMNRPPRPISVPLLDLKRVGGSGAQGIFVMLATLAAYEAGARIGLDSGGARAMGFLALIVGNFGLILAHRELSGSILAGVGRHNAALRIVFVVTASALAAALYVPALNHLFSFSPLPVAEVGTAIAVGFASWPFQEAVSRVARPRAEAA
jgi:Ca2+-transporting ATPase